jgi:hypothetical protein
LVVAVAAAAAGAATEEEGGDSGGRRRRRGVRMAAASTSPQRTGTAESAISFEPPGMGKKRTPLEMTHLEVCRSLSLSLSLGDVTEEFGLSSRLWYSNLSQKGREERSDPAMKNPAQDLRLCVI